MAGFGLTVKEAIHDLEAHGVATFDLPMERDSTPGSPFRTQQSRINGYIKSLNKHFGRPIFKYEHVEDGERFIAVAFE